MGYTKIGPNPFLTQRLSFSLLTSVLMSHPCSSEEGQWMQPDPRNRQSGLLVQAPGILNAFFFFFFALVTLPCNIGATIYQVLRTETQNK